ncbi:MAG: hypothetical protein KDK39_19520 [Leptospiraceae bacterium]|nr:hypothetical protein [Leptospiraceae bacterium]
MAIPAGLQQGASGRYDFLIQIPEARDARAGVRAMVYVPRLPAGQKAKERPVIVFFHGSTRDRTYYSKKVDYMTRRADRDGFILISVQNWWSFTDYTESIRDSRRAVNSLLWRLADESLIKGNAVYATGFSAGGLVALMTVHNSLPESGVVARQKPYDYYPYAGAASFKGNFYQGIGTFVLNPLIDPEPAVLQAHYRRQYAGKLLYLTVGGPKDAARVQKQALEARDFLQNYLGLEVVYRSFPAEGHSLSESNWQPFWQLVVSRLAR